MKKFFHHENTKYKKHEIYPLIFFVFSSFRAFVINFFFWFPIKRDLRFTPTALSGVMEVIWGLTLYLFLRTA